jgi:hypothetical protein
LSFDKIRRVLPAFRPQWNARRGVHELYDAYRAARLTREDVDNGRYFRRRQRPLFPDHQHPASLESRPTRSATAVDSEP